MRAHAQPNQPVEWRSPRDLRVHPDAGRVPLMRGVEASALHTDIAERDIQVPLDITRDGVVLDGRHRLGIALALGLDRVPVRVVDPPDEVEYMLLAALQRRQLSESQRAALALELDEYRTRHTGAAKRKRANLRNSRLDVASMPHRAGRSRDHAAKLAGVCPRLVQQAITVRSTDPALYDQVKAGQVALGRAVKDIRVKARYAEIGESPPLPTGLFDLIYADPPWQLGSPTSSSSPEQHYPTMPTPEIAALAIPAAANAVLLLWAVTSLLPDALHVIEAWGFTYKSGFVWIKPSIGPGNYVRNRHELLLIATRGNYPTPLPKHRPDSVLEAPRGRHSEKPKRFYDLLEHMWPHATRLELFARGKPHPGWTAWGNEVTP
jgi:N6-adenosine-specific RNA methylase IME4